MIKLELPYVTVTVDDRFRNRLALVGDRLRVTLTAYLRNAADDVGGLGRKATAACQTAAVRVDTALAAANDRIAPEPEAHIPHLKVV
ncbi:hypothetical protein ACRDU6_12190 [Mycolicibacterium sp. ELW1]|uniref:hypothetical protein n=1 Tax=Mycobacteriaceae TaxID=1762 RepID=UPI0011EBBAA3|nr:hypothetical protein [Mycobacterium sp. ELW1]QEN13325.1 hypothetical protein D3H54_08750 [Mycobacterium sp. ELW1]